MQRFGGERALALEGFEYRAGAGLVWQLAFLPCHSNSLGNVV